MDIAPARTRAQLEAVVEVVARVSPRSPTSIGELEHVLAADARALLLVAHRGGELAGSGFGRPSSAAGELYAMARVVREHRRRGVGRALHAALSEHARALDLDALWGRVEAGDDDSLRAARALGFDEVGREYEAILELDQAANLAAAPPEGVAIVSLAARPELVPAAYEVEREAIVDIPIGRPLVAAPFEQWRADNLEGPAALPEGCVVAIADGEVVGYAGLAAIPASPGAAEHLLTAVRREWRGRGIATALKRAQIAWAGEAGLERLVTYNDAPNDAMRAVNTKLGYVSRPVSIHVRRAR